ncbi:MAG: hypothetical protein IPK12_23400 [Gemmatimonadetes bacterium]|nr:hypothetical protein [Gemmatimonadota bacterium]
MLLVAVATWLLGAGARAIEFWPFVWGWVAGPVPVPRWLIAIVAVMAARSGLRRIRAMRAASTIVSPVAPALLPLPAGLELEILRYIGSTGLTVVPLVIIPQALDAKTVRVDVALEELEKAGWIKPHPTRLDYRRVPGAALTELGKRSLIAQGLVP